MASNASFIEQLCPACGLCCNGVIFADVQLQPGDNAEKMKSLGLPPTTSQPASRRQLRSSRRQEAHSSAIAKFPQPCAAFDGCRCGIYPDRPKYCRKFECALLKEVDAGRVDSSAALRTIRTARQRAERVRQLLRELGDMDEQLALSKRFQRMQRRMESSVINEEAADVFGQLTLAVHDLNLLLSEAFYPGH